MTTDKLNLTSTQALGVALSVVMQTCTMATCQELAKGVESHLYRMGFTLINTPECIRPETVEENKAAGTTYDIYEE